MKKLLPIIFLLTSCSACSGFMGVADDVEKIVDDNAVKLEIQREAIQKGTNIDATLKVTN